MSYSKYIKARTKNKYHSTRFTEKITRADSCLRDSMIEEINITGMHAFNSLVSAVLCEALESSRSGCSLQLSQRICTVSEESTTRRWKKRAVHGLPRSDSNTLRTFTDNNGAVYGRRSWGTVRCKHWMGAAICGAGSGLGNSECQNSGGVNSVF